MPPRWVEETFQSGRFGPTLKLRIDLHGVSSDGPGKHRTAIRWEWIKQVTVLPHGVVVNSDRATVTFPAGVFGLEPEALAERLVKAGSIFERAEIIGGMSRSEPDPTTS